MVWILFPVLTHSFSTRISSSTHIVLPTSTSTTERLRPVSRARDGGIYLGARYLPLLSDCPEFPASRGFWSTRESVADEIPVGQQQLLHLEWATRNIPERSFSRAADQSTLRRMVETLYWGRIESDATRANVEVLALEGASTAEITFGVWAPWFRRMSLRARIIAVAFEFVVLSTRTRLEIGLFRAAQSNGLMYAASIGTSFSSLERVPGAIQLALPSPEASVVEAALLQWHRFGFAGLQVTCFTKTYSWLDERVQILHFELRHRPQLPC